MNLVCTWIAGPDAGGTHALPPGRHVLGRATAADLRTEDPALEPHHLLLEVGDGGTVVVTHLTGRSAVRVDGVAVDGPTERTVTQGEGNLVEVGSSLLLVRASSDGEHVFSRSDGAGRADQPVTVVRTARPPRPMAPPPPGPPPPPPPRPERPGGLLPAVLGVAGAGVVSVIVAQPMFLLFGALGGTVAIGSWTAQWWSGRRRHRQAAQVHRQDTADHAAAVAAARAAAALACRQRTPGLAAALGVASSSAYPGRRPHPALWARRAGDDDAWTVALGLAAPGLADSGLGDSGFEHPHTAGAPTGADLAPGQRLAITGPQALGVARAVLVQLVVQCGPADLRIVVVTDRPDRWDWCRRLPHLLGPEGVASVVTDSELPDVLAAESAFDRHVLLATDAGVLLAARTSHLRRALAGGRHALLAALTDHDHGTPQWCTAILSTGVGPTAGWVPDTAATLLPDRVRTAGLGEQRAFALAGALATLPRHAAWPLPTGLGGVLGDLFLLPAEFLARAELTGLVAVLFGLASLAVGVVLMVYAYGFIGAAPEPTIAEKISEPIYDAEDDEEADRWSPLSAIWGALSHWMLSLHGFVRRLMARRAARRGAAAMAPAATHYDEDGFEMSPEAPEPAGPGLASRAAGFLGGLTARLRRDDDPFDLPANGPRIEPQMQPGYDPHAMHPAQMQPGYD
ncbi:MAG: hypothetical protein KDB12_12470, partial [Ilumatobacter sp.]|nr:hypothetical protein [Ilumatobacter sp.]